MKRTKHTRILCASKGTPMQFAQALQARISELGGEHINSSTAIIASKTLTDILDKYYDTVTDEQIADMFEMTVEENAEYNKKIEENGYGKVVGHYVAKPEYEEALNELAYLDVLDNGNIGYTLGDGVHRPMCFYSVSPDNIKIALGDTVDAATRMKKQPVNAAAGFLAKAIAVMGEAAVSMFLDKLIDKVMEWLSGQGVEGVDVTHDNDNLIVNLLGEAINIPLEGLHFDPDMIDDALKQVVEFLKGAINASTDINGQYPNDDDDDDRYYSDFGNDTDYDSDDEQYIDASTEPTVDAIIAGELNYNTPELKNLRRAIQNIVVDSDAEFIQLVNDMVNNAAINYVPETRALKRCIDNMLDYESADAVLEWVFKYAADLGCIESSNITASTEPAVDAEVERYLHTLVGDVQTELSSEVEGVKFSNDNANLYVTVTYMGSEIDYTVPLADLDLLWDNMESDVAYIVNTILQDLDNM